MTTINNLKVCREKKSILSLLVYLGLFSTAAERCSAFSKTESSLLGQEDLGQNTENASTSAFLAWEVQHPPNGLPPLIDALSMS